MCILHIHEIYMIFTFLGHSCFTLKTKGFTLLFDPFITGNSLASHIDIHSIQPDYILLSHAHGDHIADAEIIANKADLLLLLMQKLCIIISRNII
jgi:L-ascorbate metabolism protein UlaG (beta-lactamase superfamily)